MKHFYSLIDDGIRATANLMHIGFGGRENGVFLLTSLDVGIESRGQHYGSRLLEMVLNDARTTGAAILLSVVPDGTGLDDEQLGQFYGRHGFEMLSELSESAMIFRGTP